MGEGDLVVGEVVDDVGAADPGVAEDGNAALAGGGDAEDACGRAVFERGLAVAAGVDDHFAHGDGDDGGGEGEVDGRGVVCEGAGDKGRLLFAVVLGADLFVKSSGQVVGKVGQTAARVEENGDGCVA